MDCSYNNLYDSVCSSFFEPYQQWNQAHPNYATIPNLIIFPLFTVIALIEGVSRLVFTFTYGLSALIWEPNKGKTFKFFMISSIFHLKISVDCLIHTLPFGHDLI